jgi:ATP-dependent RNA helicase RhlE
MSLREGLANGEIDRTLIFSRTKHGADRIVRFLTPAGIEAAAIHGDKSQGQRTAALKGFRDGRIKVLVATDIAARGIDVTGVSHVFNFDIPNVAEQYVHRIGRTARAGADGIALSFVSDEEKPYLKAIERLTGVKLTMKPLPANFLIEAARLPAPAKRANGQPERVDRPIGGDRRREAANARGDGRARGDSQRRGAGANRSGAGGRDGQRSTGQRDHDRARGERRQAERPAVAAGPRFDPLRDASGDERRGQGQRGRS